MISFCLEFVQELSLASAQLENKQMKKQLSQLESQAENRYMYVEGICSVKVVNRQIVW